MADSKGLDPFEAFKQKKAAASVQKAEADKGEAAAKAMGWIDGLGPVGAVDPNMPKGFVKGRFKKQNVKAEELAKLRPKNLAPTKLAPENPKAKEKPVEERVPPEDERLPKKFTKY